MIRGEHRTHSDLKPIAGGELSPSPRITGPRNNTIPANLISYCMQHAKKPGCSEIAGCVVFRTPRSRVYRADQSAKITGVTEMWRAGQRFDTRNDRCQDNKT